MTPEFRTYSSVIRDIYLVPMSEIAGFRLHLLEEDYKDGVYRFWIAGVVNDKIEWGKISITESLVEEFRGKEKEFSKHLAATCKGLARDFKDHVEDKRRHAEHLRAAHG